MDSVLLGTFLNVKEIPTSVLRNIAELFHIDKVFVFKVNGENNKFLLTFNTKNSDKDESLRAFKEVHNNTIQLHRNKEHNTLFTINSLNKIIQDQAGSKNNSYKVDWSEYKNSCVLFGNDGILRVIKIRLKEIVDL